MPMIPPHSTRLKGFHLRQYRTAEGDETEVYSARIFLRETEIGYARNEGSGGADRIDILPQHRAAWGELLAYLRDHPAEVRQDGAPAGPRGDDEAAASVLRDMHIAHATLARSRKYRSGIVGYTWERLFDGHDVWWASARIFLSPRAEISAESAPRGLFRVLTLGADNAGFARDQAPPPQ